MTPKEKRIVGWIVIPLFGLVILDCLELDFLPISPALALGLGWIAFLFRVLPQVHIRLAMVFSTVVYAAAFIVSLHLFVRWLYRSTTGRPWRVRWTLSGAAMVVILFAAGLSAVGVMDHTAWLIASTQPLFKPDPNRSRFIANRAKCQSNLHQIGLAILLYQQDNTQHYPPDFSYLLRDEQIASHVFVCPASDDVAADVQANPTTQQAQELLTPHDCSYIYLGAGLVGPVPADKVVAFESLENHGGEGMNVLYGDGSATWLDREEARILLVKLQSQASTQPAVPSSN